MKILIFGSGQLGSAYRDILSARGYEAFAPENFDIRNKEEVEKIIAESQPDVVINTAAKTNLDWCEQNKEECFAINSIAADAIGEVCQKAGIYFVHVSTGGMYESTNAEDTHKEEDAPTFANAYLEAKYEADQKLLARARSGLKVLILRPVLLVSARPSVRNALAKMSKYTEFVDNQNSVTVVEDMVDATEELIQKNATGVYNIANPGTISPYGIAQLLKEFLNPNLSVTKADPNKLRATVAARRIDSVLDCSKLAGEGIELKDIHERLREIIPLLKKNLETVDK